MEGRTISTVGTEKMYCATEKEQPASQGNRQRRLALAVPGEELGKVTGYDGGS